MKKSIWLYIFALLLVLAVSGCNGATPPPPTEPPPTPAATAAPQPTEPPTATPVPEQPPTIDYLAITSDGNSVVNQINLGECVIITYAFEGTSLAASTLLRNGQAIDFDVASPGSTQDCPSDPALVGTVTYTLKVDSEFAGSTTRDAQLNVVAP